MATATSLKSVFLARRLKGYTTLVLAILGIIFAVIAITVANDQMAVVKELSESMTAGSLGVVASVINLFC